MLTFFFGFLQLTEYGHHFGRSLPKVGVLNQKVSNELGKYRLYLPILRVSFKKIEAILWPFFESLKFGLNLMGCRRQVEGEKVIGISCQWHCGWHFGRSSPSEVLSVETLQLFVLFFSRLRGQCGAHIVASHSLRRGLRRQQLWTRISPDSSILLKSCEIHFGLGRVVRNAVDL